MEAAAAFSSSSSSLDLVAVDESYSVLPSLYLAFLGIWCFSAVSWTLNTWRNRNFQVSIPHQIHVHSLGLSEIGRQV